MDKESAFIVGDLGSIPGLGRFPGEGNGYPLQYSGLDPWNHKESDTTEQLSLTQYLPCARRDEGHKKIFAVHFTNSGARNAYASEILREKNHRI